MKTFLKLFKSLLLVILLITFSNPVLAARTEKVYWEQNTSTQLHPVPTAAGGNYNVLIEGDLQVDGTLTVAAITLTGAFDADGYDIVMDTDGDTAFVNDRDVGVLDDEINIQIAGAVDFTFAANALKVLSGSVIETNIINETTAASGVTVDSVLLKDGGATLSATAPQLTFKDTDALGGDANATVIVACTDIGSGAEDCDVTFAQQVAGAATNWLAADADGNITITPTTSFVADGITLAGGTNTFNLTNGTASLDIAAGSALDVDANLTVESASTVNAK